MTNKVRKVFDLLGVEPEEIFKIQNDDNEILKEKYFFDEKLGLWVLGEKRR